jgi:hypothetical protein
MTVRELRILPPFAIARVGSASEPLDNYVVEDDPDNPLNFRRIVGAETLDVSETTGEIKESRVTDTVTFKSGDRIRPVAPFLEVFAVVLEDDGRETLRPLDLSLLHSLGVDSAKVEWRVRVANRKVVRRTGNNDNLVEADSGWLNDHDSHALKGYCKNFVSPDKWIAFGHVRFIRPNDAFSQIRLRFSPGKGLIYGPDADTPDPVISSDRAVYDKTKDWVGFGKDEVQNETLPPSLYAIVPPAPSWLHYNVAISRGYLDDTCDGFVQVRLTLPSSQTLNATARICASPPAVVPDSLFVRSLADDLEQVLLGPEVSKDEPFQVTRNRAADIVRRAYETVRFMNVHLMNGNVFQGRDPLSLDTMPEEEAADTERAIRPVMSPGTVDTLAILALHEQVYAALRGGAAPWFVDLLRKPDEVADFTDRGRRKMPALMCGADNNYLALTWRQIDTIQKTCDGAMFQKYADYIPVGPPQLTPLNLSAQLSYAATGNPLSSRPVTSVANCCPGLEVDFRAVWRRMFKGIVLREYDNLVVDAESDVHDRSILRLVGQRLLRVRLTESLSDTDNHFLMMTPIYGPAPSNPNGEIQLTTQANPHGLAPREWSNALAHILSTHQGREVFCDFTKDLSDEESEMQQTVVEDPKNYVTARFQVRPFFEDNTAVISQALADAGELTQGLCSPWQNDYRECSCYYWASARPDFVNVEPAGNGLSKGDNWLQKERTGMYVPDDYEDSRLILYDELFLEWERWLRFQIGGRDVPDEHAAGASGTA